MSKSSEEKSSEVLVGNIGSSYSNPIFYYDIESGIKSMSGRLLTIIDASISDSIQRKAIKDLIKHEIRDLLYSYQSLGSDGKQGHSIQLDALES